MPAWWGSWLSILLLVTSLDRRVETASRIMRRDGVLSSFSSCSIVLVQVLTIDGGLSI